MDNIGALTKNYEQVSAHQSIHNHGSAHQCEDIPVKSYEILDAMQFEIVGKPGHSFDIRKEQFYKWTTSV